MIKNILPEFEETSNQRSFRQSYMKEINKAYRYDESIGIMDIGEDKKISLQDIYVPLKFSKNDSELYISNDHIDLIELFSNSNNVVLSGKPGSGKTTLSRFIISSLSSYDLTLMSENFGRKIPLYIKLRDYKLEDIKSFNNFFKLFIDTMSNILKINIPKEYIEFYLRNGWCFLIFDGIDEVGNKKNRLKIRNYILKNFSKYNKNNYILVTSRPTGIENSYFFEYTRQEQPIKKSNKQELIHLENNIKEIELDDDKEQGEHNQKNVYFQENKISFPTLYYVSQFDDEQINTYSNNWFKLREENPEVIKERVRDFISSIDKIKNLAFLKRRPVFLSMMIHIHTTKGKLPYSRAMAYKYMVEAYIEHIDMARRLNKLYSKDWSFEDKERLLEELAYKLHSSSIDDMDDFHITLSKEQLKEALINIIEKNLEKWQTVEQGDENELLEFYISRTGLLHEPEENKIQFSHLSFQEYLTAHSIYKKVIENPFEIKDRIKNEILDRLNDPKWKEVILIFFSLYKDATHSILEQFKDYNTSHEYYELILTLLDSIEYGIQDSHIRFWVNNFLKFYFTKITTDEIEYESKIYILTEKLFNSERIKISLIEKEIHNLLIDNSIMHKFNFENIGIIISYNENILLNNKEFIYNNFYNYLSNDFLYLCEIFAANLTDLYKKVAEKYSLSNLILFYDNISYSGKLLFLDKEKTSWKSEYLKLHWAITNIFALVSFSKFVHFNTANPKTLPMIVDQFNEIISIKYNQLNKDWLKFWKVNIWRGHRNGEKFNLRKHTLFSHYRYYYNQESINISYDPDLKEELNIFKNNSTNYYIFLRSIMILLFSNYRIEEKYDFKFINIWDNYEDFNNFIEIFSNPTLLHKYLEERLSIEINKDELISEVEYYYNTKSSIANELKFIKNNNVFFNILSYDEFKKELEKIIK